MKANMVCSVDGCEKPSRASGMCHGHYKRLKTFGSTDVKRGSKAPLSERFWLYVKRGRDNDCWLWTGSKRGAYGKIKNSRKSLLSHRVSYELHFGVIPNGMLVCHRCDIPGCVNPNHLFLGTQADNVRDMRAKGRAVDHPRKLSDSDVLEIIRRRLAGERGYLVAASFGVSDCVVSEIFRGKSKTYSEARK